MKSRQRQNNPVGFTLIEMIIAMMIGVIIFFGLAFLMGDAQKNWNKMYPQVYSSVIADGFTARNTFDHLVRKSSGKKFLIGTGNDWIEVYYYDSMASVNTDRYGRLYLSGNDLIVEYGNIDPRITTDQITLCSYVTNCQFDTTDGAVQMWLDLQDGTDTLEVMSSAIMQNN